MKLHEETAGTSHADIDQDDVSLAGVLQALVAQSVNVIVSPQCSHAVVGR